MSKDKNLKETIVKLLVEDGLTLGSNFGKYVGELSSLPNAPFIIYENEHEIVKGVLKSANTIEVTREFKQPIEYIHFEMTLK